MKPDGIAKRIARMARPIMLSFLSLFFDKRYLTGTYFEESFAGFSWSFHAIWSRNILRLGPPMPFPVGLTANISRPENLEIHPDSINCLQGRGVYIQNFSAKIVIGRGVYIAPNVGLITANHDPKKLESHMPGKDVEIGDKCWIGMNSVILPGVVLGEGTIVGAGSVVTKSFPQGNVVIAGNPAVILRQAAASEDI